MFTANISIGNAEYHSGDVTLSDLFKRNSEFLQKLTYIIIIMIPMHFSHIILIVLKKNLHTNAYYILMNLCISDTALILVVLLQREITEEVLEASYTSFFMASILFTLAMNLDRYLKVEHGLRYNQIANKKRLLVVLIFAWIFSVLILGVAPILIFGVTKEHDVAVKGLSILCACALVVTSVWVKHVRNFHLAAITKQNNYFGIRGEEYHLLRNMKGKVKEIIQLSFMTAVLIISGSVLHIISYYVKNEFLSMVRGCLNALYVITNPFLNMFVMHELRKHYLMIFLKLVGRVRTLLGHTAELET